MFKSILLIIYNVLRIALNKMVHWNRFDVHWVQRISPLCSLKVFRKGTIRVGRNCEFAAYCDFEAHGNGIMEIGEGTYFNRYCMISAHGFVSIGDNCIFGPGVKIFDNNHRFTKSDGVSSSIDAGSIKIGKNCWIASNAIILKGADIGDNCVIGAGCIIKDVIPSGSLVRPNCNYVIEPIRS